MLKHIANANLRFGDLTVEQVAALTVKLDMLHGDIADIKSAMDKMTDAITKLALVEQRQGQTAEAMERAFKAISKVEDRVSALEQAQPTAKKTEVWVDRFVMAVVGAFLMYMAKKLGVF